MQVKLETAALAYLLHTLGAQKVVGVANARLFPDDEAARQALLTTGFAQLQAAGWLAETDAGMRTNNRLLLITAILAAPRQVITATTLAGDNRQIITIYLADGHAVEQVQTPAGQYVLTHLTNTDAIAPRLAQAFAPLMTASPWPLTLTIDRATFNAARHGQPTNLPPAQAALLAGLAPVGQIETAALAAASGGDPVVTAYDDLLLLRAADHSGWLLAGTEDRLTLTPFSSDNLATRLTAILQATAVST